MTAPRWIAGAVIVGLCFGPVAPLSAQEQRDSLIRAAFSETNPTTIVRTLLLALDPAAGPTGETWWSGVQLLAQTLVDQGRDSAAATWLRWAIRLQPEFGADTLQFSRRLVTALETARDFVRRTGVPEDSLVASRWAWPAQPVSDAVGRMRVLGAELARVTVEGEGVLAAGVDRDLAPGSYRVVVTVGEGPPATLTREVLPGVTTVVEIRAPVMARMPVPEPATPPTPELGVSPRRPFPWKWLAAGTVAVTALVAVIAGRDSGPSRGAIIVVFPPNP